MRKVLFVLMAGIFLIPMIAGAQMHNHGGHGNNTPAKPAESSDMKGMQHGHMMMNRPLQTVSVEGLKLSLDIMDMDMHMNMQKMKGNPVPEEFAKGADRAIMFYVMDESSRLIIDDADVSYVITCFKGKKETGKAKWYGDHYGAPFKAKAKGEYKLKFIVDTEGKKRVGEFTYELK